MFLPIYNLYAVYQGKPEFWAVALEKTEDFVKEVLTNESADVSAEGGSKLENFDLGVLAAFLRNEGRLKDFVESGYFVQEKHTSLLVNLLRLGYKTAAGFDASITESEGYAYVFSGDNVDVLKLCGMGSNRKAGNVILRNTPDEEY